MCLLASDAVDRTRSMNCDTCMVDGIRSERHGNIPQSGTWARAVPKDTAPREPRNHYQSNNAAMHYLTEAEGAKKRISGASSRRAFSAVKRACAEPSGILIPFLEESRTVSDSMPTTTPEGDSKTTCS